MSHNKKITTIVLLFSISFLNTKPIIANQKQLKCLSEVIYFEGRGEPEQGQRLIAKTVLERTSSDKFPDNVCSVIRQKGQFSYRAKKKLKISEIEVYKKIEKIAKFEYNNFKSSDKHPLYFLNPKTAKNKKWTKNMKIVKKIGKHVFLNPS